MQIKSILAAAAIALAVTVGSASAADQFTTLDGISAESLSSVEMAAVVGADIDLIVNGISVPTLSTDAPFDGLVSAQVRSGFIVDVVGCPPSCG